MIPGSRPPIVSKYYALVLDTPGTTEVGAVVSMVDGGSIKADVVEQRVGGTIRTVKSLGNPSFDPFSAQLGTAIAGPVVDWIKASFAGECKRLSGSLVRLNLDGKIAHTINFRDALVTEVTIPACDPKSTEIQSIGLKFQPEFTENIVGTGESFPTSAPTTAKLFTPRHFRFRIDGIQPFPVNKIEALTVKQEVKTFAIGGRTHCQVEPMKLIVPNIVFTAPLTYMDEMFAWHQDFVVAGNNSNAGEKTAALTFMSPDNSQELLTLTWQGVGMVSMAVTKSQSVGGQPESQSVRCELYAETIEIDFPNASVT